MSTLKRYEELVTFLESNKTSTVSDLLPEIRRLTSRRTRQQSSVLYDTEGTPVAIRCQFFRRWMPLVGPEASEAWSFAPRANRHSGYAAECREASKELSRQRRERDKLKQTLVDDLASGKINAQELVTKAKQAEELPGPGGYQGEVRGFEDVDQCRAYFELQGIALQD